MAKEERNRHYSCAFEKVLKLFDEDQIDECVEQAQDLLEDDGLPHYFRIKTLMLLASCIEAWDEIEECRTEAEKLWQQARRLHQYGAEPAIEAALAELRAYLDKLQQHQLNTQPSYELEDDRAVEAAEADMFGEGMEGYEDEQALAAAENDDPKALARADEAALAEELRDMEIREEIKRTLRKKKSFATKGYDTKTIKHSKSTHFKKLTE